MTEVMFANCRLFDLPVRGDDRGSLIAIEGGKQIRFDIARVYYIFNVRPGATRGFQASRTLNRCAICLNGSCAIRVDNGNERRELRLRRPDQALYVGPMIWLEMREFSPGCVLLLVADASDEANYIMNHDEFVAAARGTVS